MSFLFYLGPIDFQAFMHLYEFIENFLKRPQEVLKLSTEHPIRTHPYNRTLLEYGNEYFGSIIHMYPA